MAVGQDRGTSGAGPEARRSAQDRGGAAVTESKTVQGAPLRLSPASAIRLGLTALVVVGYYYLREPLKHAGLEPSTLAVLGVSAAISLLIFVWRKQLGAAPRFP